MVRKGLFLIPLVSTGAKIGPSILTPATKRESERRVEATAAPPRLCPRMATWDTSRGDLRPGMAEGFRERVSRTKLRSLTRRLTSGTAVVSLISPRVLSMVAFG